jgi:hypothetical protein
MVRLNRLEFVDTRAFNRTDPVKLPTSRLLDPNSFRLARHPGRMVTSSPCGQHSVLGESKSKKRGSGWNDHVLLAVQFKGYRGRVDSRAQLHVPEIAARLGVEGDEISIGIAGKNYAAGGGELASWWDC